jgi:hypothetical protein
MSGGPVPPTSWVARLLPAALVMSVVVLLPVSSVAQPSSDRADVLILENPSHLRVLDRYQRSVLSPEKIGITRYTPIVMRNTNDILSDGFTPCARVEVNGNLFFLVRDSDSRLVGAESFGYQAFYRRAFILGDTVEIRHGGRLLIQSVRRTASSYLLKGQRLERLFAHEGLTYVRQVAAGEEVFGWVTLGRSGRGSIWRVITTTPSSPPPETAQVLDRVKTVVQEVNAVLAGLYAFLNQETGERKTAPRWEVSLAGSAIICTLRSESTVTSFQESTAQLARSLETVVLATRRRVVAQPGRIELR